jgi:hypothetical protein
MLAYRRMRRWSVGRRRRLTRGAATTLAGAALLLALGSAPAQVEMISVVSGEVAILENGKCSLAEAVYNANDTRFGGQPYADCSPGNPNGADTITLPAGSVFELTEAYRNPYYNFSSGVPTIASTVTIEGHGATIRRADTAPPLRLMSVADRAGLTVRDVTFENGAEFGGAIYSYGDLIIRDSDFVENLESAVWAKGGSLTISGGLFESNSGRAGAVVAIGVPVEISGSQFLRNTALEWDGGGLTISGSGPAIVTNSVFNQNRAAGRGGGVSLGAGDGVTIRDSVITGNVSDKHGGGINAERTSLTLESSVVSHNTAQPPYDMGGGVFQNGGELIIRDSSIHNNFGTGVVFQNGDSATIENTTISGNSGNWQPGGLALFNVDAVVKGVTITANTGRGRSGGLVFSSDSGTYWTTLTLSHNLISGNELPEVFVYPHVQGDAVVVRDDYNLFGSDGDAGLVGFTPGPSDIVPDLKVTTAQILTGLGDNGGPTPTHALMSGSPAIDRAPTADCAGQTDQRGFLRNADGDDVPSDNECDIGAFEYRAVPPPRFEAFVPVIAGP